MYDPLNLICPALCCLPILLMLCVMLHKNIYVNKMGRRPLRWLKTLLGIGLGIPELARRLKMPESELRGFQPEYRELKIKKRSGGVRVLWAPNPETKKLQRALLKKIFARLKVHPNAIGFRKKHSVVHHAARHAGQHVIIKMDIVNFFPSTSEKRILAYFQRIGWNLEAAELLTRLTTHKGGLPQGAPTSPALSNLANYYLDVRLTAYAARLQRISENQQRRNYRKVKLPPLRVVYSRYADDITFSLSRPYPRRRRGKVGRGVYVRGLIDRTRRLLKVLGYTMHTHKKLNVRRTHQQQLVTGLVVNSKVNLPRKTRRWLRAVEHRLKTGGEATLTPEQLKGWKAYQQMIERQRDTGKPG